MRTVPPLPLVLVVMLVASAAALPAAEHPIRPGDDPQAVLDRAAPGDRLVFLPGVHLHRPGRHRALLYVDRSIDIELEPGATLRLADGATALEATPEITTDQDAGKKLDDLEVGGEFDRFKPCIVTIRIDSAGTGETADTFAWGIFESADSPQGSAVVGPSPTKFNETPHRGVPISGDWQALAHGVKIRFASRTGHNPGSTWFVTYDGPVAYGIRIGHGRQPDPIENVRIGGRGTIDMNATHNVQPGFLVKDINACVLVHGRVRGVLVEGITMTDTNRSVMCYGEHSGAFLPGGGVTEGESFDAEDITIRRTRTLNPNGAGYLLGHPSFRGRLRRVVCNDNYMETGVTAIEPNFNLDGYEVIGNVMKCGSEHGAIHCWRHSRNGVIRDNLRIHDNTGKPVVVVNAPRGWEKPEPPQLRNNRNHLSDAGEPAPPPDGPAGSGTPAGTRADAAGDGRPWEERRIEGWRVLVSRALVDAHAAATAEALDLLAGQLREIVRVVPAAAVARLRAVPLHLSPAYAGIGPRAEYHPDAGWLRRNGRDPSMEKGVEFTNVLIFPAETRRMPNFVLHELAHAYHDRELPGGHANAEVIAAFERARAAGGYERVERQDAEGRRTVERAYALTSPPEYFAECTEAYFSRNDFFPFCRAELERHDPQACRLLEKLWGVAAAP